MAAAAVVGLAVAAAAAVAATAVTHVIEMAGERRESFDLRDMEEE